jgi:hypothetical protein
LAVHPSAEIAPGDFELARIEPVEDRHVRGLGRMGNLTDMLHLSLKAVGNIIKGLAAYPLAGSYILLIPWRCAARLPAMSAAMTRLACLLSAAGFISLGASALTANDFKASGEVQSIVIVNSQTTLVQTVTFTVARIGTNWSILNGYSGVNIQSYNAMVDGTAYLANLNTTDDSTSGLVFGKPEFQLEGAPAFARCVFGTFLVSQELRHHLTNVPVPFLEPRDPAFYAYDWDVQWSKEPPGLAAHILFTLNKDWPQSKDQSGIDYFYGRGFRKSGKSPARLVKDFKRAQSEMPPEYRVHAWTNFGGRSYPAVASFSFLALEETLGVFKNVALVRLSSIEPPGDYPLLPPLTPDSTVCHVIGNTSYTYKTASGKWLTRDEAQRVGIPRAIETTPEPRLTIASIVRYLVLLLLALLAIPTVFWLSKMLRRRTIKSAQTISRMIMSAVLLFVMSVMTGAAESPALAQTNTFDLEGVLKSVSFSPSGKVLKTTEKLYKIQAGGGQWGFRIQDLGDATESKHHLGVVLYSDGRDIFTVNTFDQSAVNKALRDPGSLRRPGNSVPNYAMAYPGPYPVCEPFLTRLVWLAFCSGSFLKTNNSTRMPYIGTWPGEVAVLDYDWTPLDAATCLPRELTFTRTVPSSTNQVPSRVIAGKYRVLSTTNCSGALVPTEFEFVSYFGGTNTIPGTHLRARIASTARLIKSSPTNDYRPQLPKEANVSDLRFAELYQPLNYVKKSRDTWLKRDDPDLLLKIRELSPKDPTRGIPGR